MAKKKVNHGNFIEMYEAFKPLIDRHKSISKHLDLEGDRKRIQETVSKFEEIEKSLVSEIQSLKGTWNVPKLNPSQAALRFSIESFEAVALALRDSIEGIEQRHSILLTSYNSPLSPGDKKILKELKKRQKPQETLLSMTLHKMAQVVGGIAQLENVVRAQPKWLVSIGLHQHQSENSLRNRINRYAKSLK